MIAKGKLSRERLMRCSIEALERDFNHYRAKWFFQFFDRLQPNQSELLGYAQNFLGLLGASAPNVAAWALEKVADFVPAKVYASAELCHALEPVLRARAKGTVLTALKVLESQRASHPEDAPLIALTVAKTLGHESPDVQKAVLKSLDTIGCSPDEELLEVVRSLQPMLAPSTRTACDKWLATHQTSSTDDRASSQVARAQSGNKQLRESALSPSQSALSPQLERLFAIDALRKHMQDGRLEIPAAIYDGTDVARLSEVSRLQPIETIDELIDVCARVIEDGSLVDDAERCIDGLARLGQSKPEDLQQMAAPLLKRVRKLVLKGRGPFCGIDPAWDVLGLFYAFCTGRVITPVPGSYYFLIDFEGHELKEYQGNTRKAIGFLSAHCLEIAKRIAGGAAWQLLSAPTHVGGWIDAEVLAERANARIDDEPYAHEIILALLRLALTVVTTHSNC